MGTPVDAGNLTGNSSARRWRRFGRTPAAIAPAGFALCMRSHSEPKFADPSTSTGVGLQIGLSAGIAWSSPSFERVQSACKSLLAGVAQ
jgi:hypothetical protein